MADNEELVALLQTLPADFNVDVRAGSVWMRCPNPDHAQTGNSPPFKVTTEIGPYVGTSHCFGCSIGGGIKKTMEMLGLSTANGLRPNTPYDVFNDTDIAQMTGRTAQQMPPTEDWPSDVDWRSVDGQLVCDVGGRMMIAGDGYEPLLILPVVMRGRQIGYVKCKVHKAENFNYVNAGSKWAGDALFPYDYVRKMLDDSDGPRVAAIVEGCRDALVTIQNGLPALATLGATNWTPKCVSAVKALGLNTLVCLTDPDDAGDMLASNVYNDLKSYMTVKVVRLPSKIIETDKGPKRVKVLDAADLSAQQLRRVLSKLGVEGVLA